MPAPGSHGASARIWASRRADTETVAWLVENHLADVDDGADARPQRPQDDRAISPSIVQSVERLKLLLILTVCDIRGVGPGVWNGWKGQLLRTLYYETELLLTGGFSEVSRADAHGGGARAAGRGACRLAGKGAQALCQAALRELSADRRS